LGAQQTVLAIPRALPLVHAGPGCAGKVFQFSSYGAGFQGEGYGGGGIISCTNTAEEEVVFGGENKLRDLIRGALRVLDADLLVALSGCTSGIVGDDVEQIASEFAAEGFPVVGAETSGFKGNSYYGHELVMEKIIAYLTEGVKPEIRRGAVNVFSVAPFQNPFWRGDLEEIKRVLSAVGLEVNILFGAESAGIAEWRDIPHAQFNIVLSSWVGLKTAQYLEKTYGTPYLHIPFLPIGAAATSRFLRRTAEFGGISANTVNAFIEREEEKFYAYIVTLADFIADLRNNIPFELYTVADSSYALGVSDYLVNELGFDPKGIYITDCPDSGAEKIVREAAELLAPEFASILLFSPDGGAVQSHIKKTLNGSRKALIMGSTWEDDLAAETNNLSVHLSLPINNDVIISRSFAGYGGGLRLTEEIYAGIFRKGNIAQTTQTL
jgi:nitrogenase molybdenum-iron protein beta chain